MDQIIDKFGISWESVLAEIVNFAILFGFLYWVFYKKILHHVEARQKKIEEGLKKADESDKILEEAQNERKNILAQSREEADKIREDILKNAKNREEDILKKAEEKSDKILSDSQKKALEEKEKIIKSSKDEVAKMAILAAEKILMEK